MTSLEEAFDAASFRTQGHALIDQIAEYFTRVRSTGTDSMPVLPWVDPESMRRAWPASFEKPGEQELSSLVARVLAESNHLHHPRYMGHQVAVSLPLASLTDLVSSVLNNAMAIYETGPVSTSIERNLAAWLARQVGFGTGADGIFTSGGSVGNLTALLAARSAMAGYDLWEEGSHAGPPLALLASEQTHYCVKRAVQIMGWGAKGVSPVAVDGRFRMKAAALADAKKRAEDAGRRVIAVVASAASTATGAFDPLDEVADFCEANKLWFHVDGAHGASAVLSDKYRHLTRGIERADSVVWDAHKMMLMPSLLTAVLFRDGKRSYEAFAQQASYLFDGAARPEDEWFNSGTRTLECSKSMMATKLFVGLSVYGKELFADYVTRMFDLGARFAERLETAPDFELPAPPDGNIVCFRYMPPGLAVDKDALQLKIRRQILGDGSFYIVQTRLPSGLHLRVTFMNPFTSAADLDALIDRVRAAA